MRTKWLAVAVSLAAVAGCDSKPKEPTPDLVKSQRQAMDKAKAVEQVLKKSAEERAEPAEKRK
jgi:uncharacterized protein YcfL